MDKPHGAAFGLTFSALRQANIARLPTFKNKHGDLAHSKADGSDWSPAQWLQAVVGELGEYANIRKKYERGDLTAEEFAIAAGKELADVQTYLDILALRCLDTAEAPHPHGVDLGMATAAKFNEVSERVGSPVRLSMGLPEASAQAIEIADHVHHRPSGEDWVVARVDDEHVYPAGWPACRAKLSDCELIRKASPASRANLIADLKQLPQTDERSMARSDIATAAEELAAISRIVLAASNKTLTSNRVLSVGIESARVENAFNELLMEARNGTASLAAAKQSIGEVNAALDYAVDAMTDDGLGYLRAWREGDWKTIRSEWPGAPTSAAEIE